MRTLEPREAGVWLKVARSVHGRAGLGGRVPALLCGSCFITQDNPIYSAKEGFVWKWLPFVCEITDTEFLG